MLSINPAAILDATENSDTLNWSFDSGAEAFDYLAVGETLILQYTIAATDDDGTALSDTETVTITIIGSNDAPIAVADAIGTDENTVLNSNVPAASDVDGSITGYTLGATTVAEGNLVFNADGSYSFDPGSDFDDLINGSSRTVTFTYTAIDNDGAASAEQTITITVTGSNDVPVIGGVTSGTVIEDVDVAGGMISTSGTLTINDADAGESNFVAATINGVYGILTIDAVGNWNYSADNTSSDIQSLRTGETLVESLAVTTADGSSFNITIRINGAEDTVLPSPADDDETAVLPPDVSEPLPLPEPPEAAINRETVTAIEDFDSEEIYTTPQIREPGSAITHDPEGIEQFVTSESSEIQYLTLNSYQQNPVLPPEIAVHETNVDNLEFQVSDDEELNQRLEMALLNRIELMRMGMDDHANNLNADDIEVKVFIGATTSLTAGIVSWVLRGGSLLASLMGTVPLLNRFDPLPILKSRNDEEDVEPDDDEDDTEITGPFGKRQKRVDNMFSKQPTGPQHGGFVDE
jgi:VCBS repeat-containing protein